MMMTMMISIASSIESGILQELITVPLKAFHSYAFRVSIMLCDGASSNLSVLKTLTGTKKEQFHANERAQTLHERYFADASFPNPKDPNGWPIFVMICPSHQV